MSLSIGAAVNPDGAEIAAAFSLWSAGLALAMRPAPLRTGMFVQAGVAGVLLINTRTSGAVWAVVIVASLLVYADEAQLRAVARTWRTRWLLAPRSWGAPP